MSRPRLSTNLNADQQAHIDEVRSQIDPSLLGEVENGGEMATPMEPTRFVPTQRHHYRAEYGVKGRDIVFHFFPLEDDGDLSCFFPDPNTNHLGDAFHEVFKLPERLEAAPIQAAPVQNADRPEAAVRAINSWAVRAVGFNSGFGDINAMATRLFDALDRRILTGR